MARAAVVLTLIPLALAASLAEAADPPPLRVGLVIDSTDDQPLGPRLRTAVHGIFDRDARLSIKTLDVGAMEEPASLGAADAARERAEKLFREADLDPAKAAIDQAQKAYEENLVDLVRRDGSARALRDTYLLLAKVRFFEGNFEAAKEALRHVFALDPKVAYTPQLFPQQMRRVVVEARLLFDTLGFSRVEIASEPPGAALYVNGVRAAGPTPTTVELACGPNIVELRLAGHLAERRAVDVGASEGKETPRLTLKLRHADDPSSRAREATAAIGAGARPDVDLEPVAASLGVDALVLIHVGGTSESRFHLAGAVYRRARPGKHPAPAGLDPTIERNGETTALEGEAEALAQALDEAVGTHRPAVATPEAGEGRWQRFRHSKAFWWVVGGVGAAVVTGVAVGAGVGAYEAHQREIAREVVLLGGR